MHPNPTFRQEPLQRHLAFVRARGFGVLSVNGPEGPIAAHVPFLLAGDDSFADLHLARSNPIVRAGLPAPALLAVAGPDTYVSPDYYGPHQEVPDQVPTWNYVAVHLRGILEPLPEEELRLHVDALSAEHEGRITGKTPWTSAKMTEGAMPRMMRMILPFRLRITIGRWDVEAEPEQAGGGPRPGSFGIGGRERGRPRHCRADARGLRPVSVYTQPPWP